MGFFSNGIRKFTHIRISVIKCHSSHILSWCTRTAIITPYHMHTQLELAETKDVTHQQLIGKRHGACWVGAKQICTIIFVVRKRLIMNCFSENVPFQCICTCMRARVCTYAHNKFNSLSLQLSNITALLHSMRKLKKKVRNDFPLDSPHKF